MISEDEIRYSVLIHLPAGHFMRRMDLNDEIWPVYFTTLNGSLARFFAILRIIWSDIRNAQ